MENIQLNAILEREELFNSLINTVHTIFANRNNPLAQRGVYIYGAPGTGKTEFVLRAMKLAGFDVVRYDASDARGKSVMETLTKQHMPEVNIMSLWNMKQKKIVIVMDEIEAMNSGDKGGINTLMKLLRPKKTKKQLLEGQNFSPIICIGDRRIDKKIGDLMKVCKCYEMPTPTHEHMDNVIKQLFQTPILIDILRQKLVKNVGGDLRKLSIMYEANRKGLFFDAHSFDNILTSSSKNEDAKQIVRGVINEEQDFKKHGTMIGDNDRTIVGLLWHENIVDMLGQMTSNKSIPIYLEILRNLCIGDYVDRNTFQKQIWQFNEISSIIKTMIGHHIYHKMRDTTLDKYTPKEVRFTRVLTKYSSEFNNFSFTQTMCQKLGIDKSDLFALFIHLNHNGSAQPAEVALSLANYDIVKQEVERMFKMTSNDWNKTTRKTTRKPNNDDEDIQALSLMPNCEVIE